MTPENASNGADTPEISDETKNSGAMSYFLIFAPILYMTRKDSDFIRFHALQGSVLLGAFILFWTLGEYFPPIKYLNLGVFLGAVVGFIQAVQGEKYSLPLVSEIIKEGVSPKKIWKGIIRAGKIFGKIILGFFPKSAGEKISKTLKIDPDVQIIQRLENIEKILIQEKFLQPEISESLSKTSESAKNFFAEIISVLTKYDKNLHTLEEESFLEISGNFGTVIIGGIKNTAPEFFSYAIASEIFPKQKDSIVFGGFVVGRKKIGEMFIEG